jgi:hypothetical protein
MQSVPKLRLLGAIFALAAPNWLRAEFSLGETHSLARSDASQITYYLQRPEESAKVPLLLVLQGSQFESVQNHPVASQGIPQRFKSALLMIEKPGVHRGSTVCTEDYKRLNSLDARQADVLWVLASLRESGWWNGKLLLLGGSEGGPLAVKLSAALTVERAVLLVMGGGMTMEEAMPTIMRESMKGAPPDLVEKQIAALPGIFADIRRNPDSTSKFFGDCNSYKYWNSLLWFRPVETMLKTSTRYFLVHGDRDVSHPVESARVTAKLFEEAGSDRLTYKELPGLDHSLTDSNGKSHLKDVMDSALAWLFAADKGVGRGEKGVWRLRD